MQQKLIVIVDEDEAVRDSLRFSLGAEGFDVLVFASGRQLLAEVSLPSGDCIVVEQHARDMTGLDLISMLRSRNFTAPAILIASRSDPELYARAAAAGIPVVEKPLLDFTLVDSVRRSLAGPVVRQIRP